MRRSRLELYEEIICALAKKALTIDNLAFECGTSCILLQDQLDFLVSNEIISIEISLDGKAFYVLTRRGLGISRTLTIAKRLEKLQTSQNAVETLNILSEFTDIKEKAKTTSCQKKPPHHSV